MELPEMLQGASLTRLVQGALAGAAATMVIGFNWGGWALGSTAEKNAQECRTEGNRKGAGPDLRR